VAIDIHWQSGCFSDESGVTEADFSKPH